jgi:hypothetical protein
MTTEQFDALMNAIDAVITANLALNLKWTDPQKYTDWANIAEQTARDLLVTDSPTEN